MRCCALSEVGAPAAEIADKEQLILRRLKCAMLLISDIDSRDELVLFMAQGNALARRSVDGCGRRHPVKSRSKATAAMQKVENTASLMTQLE